LEHPDDRVSKTHWNFRFVEELVRNPVAIPLHAELRLFGGAKRTGT
jgi:hypothetical protein